jgi:phosphonate transport system substrate-binding protein
MADALRNPWRYLIAALGLAVSSAAGAGRVEPDPTFECRLGTYAYGGFDRASALEPLADWLAAHTDCRWQIQVLESPARLAQAAAGGELEWALPNLVGYLLAKRSRPELAAPLRVAVPAADADRYRSVLLARRGEHVELQTLRSRSGSRRLGLTFADSASGGLMPRAMLAEAGVDAERDFAKLIYTGRHDASLRALLAGELDVVGLPLEVLPHELAPQVDVLARSAPIPVGPMLCGGRIQARCFELAAALLAAPEAAMIARAIAAAWPEFGAARGFEPSKDPDYAALLSLLPEAPQP